MSAIPSLTSTWHTDTYAAISPTQPSLSLSGKTAIITGAGTGIGAAIAFSFAKAGISKLALLGRRETMLQETKSRILSFRGPSNIDIITLGTDITSSSSVDATFASIAAQFGHPEILVSNAGYFETPTTIADQSIDEWWKYFETNVKGSFNVVTAFLKHAVPNATVLNVSTPMAHAQARYPGFSGYTASKAASLRFFDYVQVEWPQIRVVNINPGAIATAMAAKVSQGKPRDTPELAGDFAVWAVSDEAAFLKGKLVWSNWDVLELKEKTKAIEGTSLLTLTLDGWPFEYKVAQSAWSGGE